jgi:DNA-directed RNA polymerase specialized sigma24 family protein
MLEKSVQDDWGAMLVKEISYIRGFAISLAGSVTAADDLVQDTLIRALVHRNTFDLESPTRNVRAWLITILHNAFYSSYRKHNREVQDTNGFGRTPRSPVDDRPCRTVIRGSSTAEQCPDRYHQKSGQPRTCKTSPGTWL